MRNVKSENGILPPGIVRCNETNPCQDITFDNVQMDGWFTNFGLGYISENIYGTVTNSYPVPEFTPKGQPINNKPHYMTPF